MYFFFSSITWLRPTPRPTLSNSETKIENSELRPPPPRPPIYHCISAGCLAIPRVSVLRPTPRRGWFFFLLFFSFFFDSALPFLRQVDKYLQSPVSEDKNTGLCTRAPPIYHCIYVSCLAMPCVRICTQVYPNLCIFFFLLSPDWGLPPGLPCRIPKPK